MQIHVSENKKEIKMHGSYDFPVGVSLEVLSQYEGGSFLWHWHPEIELTLILKGEIDYYINDKHYHLTQGEGVFGNANTLHSGRMNNHEECIYVSITFNPKFIYGYENSILQTKYVNPIVDGVQLSSLQLSLNCSWQKEILEAVASIYNMSKDRSSIYEIRVHVLLCNIWLLLYQYFTTLPITKTSNEKNIERLKHILSFIHEHYLDKISLEDIASSISICKSECCRFFKKHMKMSLFEYLLYYRIEQSLPLLMAGEYNITGISERVGFSNSCYYGKIFKRYMNCSPSEYRMHLDHRDI